MNKKIVFILTGAVIAALLVGIGLGRVIFPPSDGHAHAPALRAPESAFVSGGPPELPP